MTVNDLCNIDGFSPVSLPDGDREINGVYIGDLLSWVMGKARSDNAWITIMSNINTLAVATLTDVSCIILAEGVTLEDNIRTAAESKGINVISSRYSAYDTALILNKAL
ncbi:MAG: hypothetical protein E7566_06660 [Ruminococcaceae bacterium]|nr:hypothetical protein [Oscillospiraceae bacterium]